MTNPEVIIIRGLTQGGVRRLIFALLDQWKKLDRDHLPTLIHNEPDIQRLYPEFPQFYCPSRSKAYFDLVWSVGVLIKLKPSLILYPKNIIPITHFGLPYKKVNIIHDLGYFDKEINAYPWADTLYMTSFFKLSCRHAKRTLSISESTKKDAIDRLGLDSREIGVISGGVEESFFSDSVGSEHPESRYYLYAGSMSPRKNLKRVIHAVLPILKEKKRKLVITGLKSWGDADETRKLAEENSAFISILGFVSEEELKRLYQGAIAFLYPSLYEGFGLPILEAQASGCPVITSNRGACSETARDSAVLVDPMRVESIRDGLIRLDELDRSSVIKAGVDNARYFSWKRAYDLLNEQLNLVRSD